jgi:hypothetical protein
MLSMCLIVALPMCLMADDGAPPLTLAALSEVTAIVTAGGSYVGRGPIVAWDVPPNRFGGVLQTLSAVNSRWQYCEPALTKNDWIWVQVRSLGRADLVVVVESDYLTSMRAGTKTARSLDAFEQAQIEDSVAGR